MNKSVAELQKIRGQLGEKIQHQTATQIEREEWRSMDWAISEAIKTEANQHPFRMRTYGIGCGAFGRANSAGRD